MSDFDTYVKQIKERELQIKSDEMAVQKATSELDRERRLFEKQKEKRRNKLSFSKKFIIAVAFMGFLMFVYTLAYSWHFGDSAPLNPLIPSVFGAFAVASGFFLKKAEKENALKIQQQQEEVYYSDVED